MKNNIVKIRWTRSGTLKRNTAMVLLFFSFSINGSSQDAAIVDVEGNTYKTVKIGHQIWMAKNLNVGKFRNGDPIPYAKTKEEWHKATENQQPAWCYYDYNASNGRKYGKLYNWYAVIDSRGLAPARCHIPSKTEWEKLVDYLGKGAGTKMKSTSGWNSYTTGGSKTCPNCQYWNTEYRNKVPCHTCRDTRKVSAPTKSYSGNGLNSIGFDGLPAGYSAGGGRHHYLGSEGSWWSSTEISTERAGAIALQSRDITNFHTTQSYNISPYKFWGLSVRCLASKQTVSDDLIKMKETNSNQINQDKSTLTITQALGNVLERPDTIVNAKDLVSVEFLLNDQLYSVTDYYYANGNKKSRATRQEFVNHSRLDGEQLWYYENGQLSTRGYYENGLKSGEWRWYSENGKILTVKNYSEGFETGEVRKYYESGKIKYSGEYYKGKQNGYWVWYNENGQVNVKGEYYLGKPTGQFVFYNEDGSIKEINNH